MTYKITITQKMPEIGVEMLLNKGYDLTYFNSKQICSREWLKENLPESDAVWITINEKVDTEFLDWIGSKLKIISTLAVGYDNIDLKEVTKRNILVAYTPEVLSSACADYSFALALSLYRKIKEADNYVKEGKWKEKFIPLRFSGEGFNKKTLGILGYGRIGREVAKRAVGFEMTTIYNDRSDHFYDPETKATPVSIEELFTKSDILVICASLNETSKKLVDLKLICKMKPTSIIINIARGQIIKEEDLIYALENKIIYGAGLDVFENEPLTNSKLLKMENVLLSPHIASEDRETRDNMARMCVNAIINVLEGKKPYNIVGDKK